MKTIQLFNGRANETQDAELAATGNEIVATFSDGHFVKFSATTAEELQAQIDLHNQHNAPRLTAEMESAANAQLESIIDSL